MYLQLASSSLVILMNIMYLFPDSRDIILGINPLKIAQELKDLGPTLYKTLHSLLSKPKEDETASLQRIGAACASLLHLSNERLSTYAVKASLFMKASGTHNNF